MQSKQSGIEMKTVKERWHDFAKMVIPKGAPSTQYREMEKAFYCGFQSAIWALEDTAKESSDIDLDEGATMIQLLNDECETFIRQAAEKMHG